MKNEQNFILSNTVAFIGLMGAGKTTLGRQFAKTICADFVDSDEEIVQRAGISIPEIFELSGEEKFRNIENRVIADILRRSPVILSTGGGTFISDEIREMLNNTSVTIWLRTKPETLLARMENFHNRPLLANGDPLLTLAGLYKKREPFYKKAHIVIDTDNLSTTQSLNIIIKELKDRNILRLKSSRFEDIE